MNSDAYKKAQKKNSLLPKVENDAEARAALQLLPLNMLALRVSKKDPHEVHNNAKTKKEKRVKGLWHVKIEQQQEFDPTMHYIWLFEGPQWKTKMWAALALIAVFAVVLFPLWPFFMRQGVWYGSWGLMGLLPPGLWLYPNLFEDVGFFDSFRPFWGWHETKEDIKRKKQEKKARKAAKVAAASDEKVTEAEAKPAGGESTSPPESATSTSVDSAGKSTPAKRHAAPTVEEAVDE